MGLPTDLFKCRECGIKTSECSEVDISVCVDCGNELDLNFKEVYKMDNNITKEQHIKEHTKIENTHDFNCPYCEGLK